MRVLLAEDDNLIGGAIKQRLNDEAYAVDWVLDGESAIAAINTHTYSLLLLDLGLPRKDGMKILREIRRASTALPVIIITARDDVDVRVKGLDLGADDFLVKPFSMNELLARMRAVIRRNQCSASVLLGNGDIELDPASHKVFRDGEEFSLTAREFSLLRSLLQRPGAILSRDDIEERIYGWNEEVESNAIEFIIHSIRKKLGSDVIKNIRGVGWMVAKGK